MTRINDGRKKRGAFAGEMVGGAAADERLRTEQLPDEPGEFPIRNAPPPDSGLLYSVDDIATLASVSKVLVVRLCLAGQMPEWREIQGRRYWDRRGAIDAVARAIRAGEMLHRPRKIA